LAQNTSNERRVVTIHPPARLVGEPKKTKKERKEGRKKDPKQWQKFRPDHPRRRIKIKHCVVGGLRCVVIHVKCDPNRSRPFPITLASGLYNILYYRTNRVDYYPQMPSSGRTIYERLNVVSKSTNS